MSDEARFDPHEHPFSAAARNALPNNNSLTTATSISSRYVLENTPHQSSEAPC